MALLQVSNLRVVVGPRRHPTAVVVRGALAVEPGETLGLVGESGSGKTMSGLAILGLLPAGVRTDGGQALFDGQDLLELDRAARRRLRAKQMKMVFQDPMTSLNPVMRVGAQVREAVQAADPAATRRQVATESLRLLDLVGIPDPARRIHQFPHEFSGGMRQRVMLAMAIASKPRLLIADEPTTALDVTVQAQVVRLVKELQEHFGTAVVWITHDLALLAGMSDRVSVMYGGRVVESAPAEAVYAAPRHPYTVGLLRSVPAANLPHKSPLPGIAGFPPDPADLGEGCPFAPRCPHLLPKCLTSDPPERAVGPGRTVACWVGELEAEKGQPDA
ncbi:MAG: ABC transporter ATP-binding protein [Bifidobacteriaceae bacterium]|jgi:oligopeptide/dipeptide ABC transporter ATP-binding protein|nr:ABC transporter ATP-binding protein [Bifidobacteriaceae bacterium]